MFVLRNVFIETLASLPIGNAVPVFQVKAQQAEVMRILESKNIKFELIDISVGGDVRNEMRTKSGNPTAAPPQIFNEDQYCGVRMSLMLSCVFCCRISIEDSHALTQILYVTFALFVTSAIQKSSGLIDGMCIHFIVCVCVYIL